MGEVRKQKEEEEEEEEEGKTKDNESLVFTYKSNCIRHFSVYFGVYNLGAVMARKEVREGGREGWKGRRREIGVRGRGKGGKGGREEVKEGEKEGGR